MTDCIFCKIAAGQIPATLVAQNDVAVAFRDLSPQAPVHLLVIPREHIASVAAVPEDRRVAVLGGVAALAAAAAEQEGLADRGYRLVANTGPDGGQSVDHLHFHVLGGRKMDWPPG